MTSADPTRVVDLRTVLFEDPSQAATVMTAALVSGQAGEDLGGALGRMPDSAKKAVLDRVGTAAEGLLDQNLTDIVGMAWSKHTVLRDAAVATLAEPGTVREVELAAHTVSFAHDPAVELRVGDHAIATVTLQIRLELQIKGLTAGVRRGRLTTISAGSCDIVGTLTLMDSQVTQRRVTLDLPLTMRLGKGISLLADDTEEPGPDSR
jgi:hypothetical protein